MRLVIAAVGRLKAGPERELYTRYADRIDAMARGVGLRSLELHEFEESRARRAEERRTAEARHLATCCTEGAAVALDERGADLTSDAFAALISEHRTAPRDLIFLIGGPDGLDPALLARVGRRLRFGAMTLPHGLVRVLLAEQIYRAITILSGHPYHRGNAKPS